MKSAVGGKKMKLLYVERQSPLYEGVEKKWRCGWKKSEPGLSSAC